MSTVLDVRGVHLRRGARRILGGITFTVPRGAIVALMGSSGSGKTTILRAIAGLERFDEGAIAIDGLETSGGRRLAGHQLRQWRSRMGFVFQFHHLFEHLTAIDNVTLAPVHVHRMTKSTAETRARELLHSLGVEHRAGALPRELSGGEAQRVAIARALALDPPLLMMDEPTASLDPERRTDLGVLLRALAGRGRAVLISTHDDVFARDFTTDVRRLADGALVEPGPDILRPS